MLLNFFLGSCIYMAMVNTGLSSNFVMILLIMDGIRLQIMRRKIPIVFLWLVLSVVKKLERTFVSTVSETLYCSGKYGKDSFWHVATSTGKNKNCVRLFPKRKNKLGLIEIEPLFANWTLQALVKFSTTFDTRVKRKSIKSAGEAKIFNGFGSEQWSYYRMVKFKSTESP